MNWVAILLMASMCVFSLLFGFSEGRRARNKNINYELGIRSAFECSLVLELLKEKGTIKEENNAAYTTAAMLAATKLQIFRKGIYNAQNNNRGTKET